MTNTYIETGSRIRVYDSTVQAHASLPLGTYRVHFDPKEGFSLQRVQDLEVGSERVYGGRGRKISKIFNSYQRIERSLGVMLSGDKGQGKSLFVRMLAERAIKAEIPVVLVTEDADGIAEFLDTLDECLIVFDEFEKTFPAGGPRTPNRQNQFLPLFDGLSSVKRIYCLTVNGLDDVSSYIVNRPGRFHYHMRFRNLGPDDVREYLQDQAPDAPREQVEKIARLSLQIDLNYDHLRSIAFELNDPEADFSEIVGDLNIKSVEPSTYRCEAQFDNAVTLFNEVSLNLFERPDDSRTIELSNGNRTFYFSFIPRHLAFHDDGSIWIPVDKLEPTDDDFESYDELPLKITLTLVGQSTYAFDTI